MAARYFQDEHERVWTDEFGPFVFAHVQKLATEQDAKYARNKTVEAIRFQLKKFKFVYSILDTSAAEAFTVGSFIAYCNERLAGQFKAGLEHVAFLAPRDSENNKAIISGLKELPFASSIALYDSFEHALQHATQLWQARLNR